MITVSHESDLWMSGGIYSLPFPFDDDIIWMWVKMEDLGDHKC